MAIISDESKLLAGVARTEISPSPGMRLAGSLRDTRSKAVHQELTTSAVYLREDGCAVVIIAIDLIMLPPEDARRLREEIGHAIGVPVENVLIGLSHSHATPSPIGWKEHDYEASPEERSAVVDYFARLMSCTIEMAQKAKSAARPARLASGSGSSDININRREKRADGSIILGRNPDGPVDHEVGVIRVDDTSGAPIAVIFNFGCHPDVLGPKSPLISPDLVGPARNVVEATSDVVSVFLQGACGDIYPVSGIVNGDDGVDEAERLGHRLGAEVLRVSETLRTHRKPAKRAEWVSAALNVTTNWFYGDIPPPTGRQLAATSLVVQMPLRQMPSREEAVALVKTRDSERAKLPVDAPLSVRLIASRRLAWARLQLQAIEDQMSDTLPVEVQALRLGDAVILAVPGELFAEIGMAMKQRSPFANTLVAGCTNGVYFYIPTRSAFAQGGYEINSHQNYMRPTGPTADWEDILLRISSTLIERLV